MSGGCRVCRVASPDARQRWQFCANAGDGVISVRGTGVRDLRAEGALYAAEGGTERAVF